MIFLQVGPPVVVGVDEREGGALGGGEPVGGLGRVGRVVAEEARGVTQGEKLGQDVLGQTGRGCVPMIAVIERGCRCVQETAGRRGILDTLPRPWTGRATRLEGLLG